MRSRSIPHKPPGSWIRRILRGLAALGVFLVLLTATNFIRMQGWSLRRGLREELARANAVADAVTAMGPEQLHRGLHEPSSGSPYRDVFLFDAHLDRAVYTAASASSAATSSQASSETPSTQPSDPAALSVPWVLEFEEGDTATFGEGGAFFEVSEGTLKAKSGRHRYVEIAPASPLDWSGVDEVEIRIRAHREGVVSLLMTEDVDEAPQTIDLEGRNSMSRFGKIEHRLIPDGEFQMLRIRADSAIESFFVGRGARIARLYLMPSDANGDEVEIDYIRLISRESKYRALTHGAAAETFGGERRETVFVRTPGTLRFPAIRIPDNEPALSFGLNRLHEDVSLEVAVALETSGRREDIYAGRLEGGTSWVDVDIDLSEWSGQTADLLLKVKGGDNTLFWSNPILTGKSDRRMNVILVLEDTFRADRLDIAGGSEGRTPAKAEWAKNSVVFSRGFSPSPLTRMSCPSLMTSMYPTANGIRKATDVLSPRFITLAEILRSRGFATASFVQNPNAGALAGLQQGFGTYFDWDAIGLRAESLYGSELETWLERSRNRNFFLYLHLIDPHFPYQPPEPFLSRADEKRKQIEAAQDEALLERKNPLAYLRGNREEELSLGLRLPMYEGEIAYNDQQFGRFLDQLERMDLLENTLLIFVSDHGEYFGEHGGYEFHHPPTYTQVVHVPFMLSYPGAIEGGRTIDVPVSLVDVMPTILDFAGIEGTAVPMHGRSLASLIRGENPEAWKERPVFADEVSTWDHDEPAGWGSVLFRDWHWIRSHGFRTSSNRFVPLTLLSRGYNRKSDPDQERLVNALFLDAPLKGWMAGYLEDIQNAHLRTWRAYTRGEVETADYDDATLDHLRDLGYLN